MNQPLIGGIVLALIGVLLIAAPRTVWNLTERWKHMGATDTSEASAAYVWIVRILGAVAVVIGVLVACGVLQ